MDAVVLLFIIAGVALLVQAGLALIVGYLAGKRGRSAVAYFWLSFLLTFVIGLIVLLIQTSGSQLVKRDYQNPNFGFLDGERAAKCPKCAEWIKVEASVCKHCGHEVGEYIQAEMQTQQAEESARQAKLETELAAEREASQAARTKMLKSKKFRLAAGSGALVILALVSFVTTYVVRNEMAKQPAKVTNVEFSFDRTSFQNPSCPVIEIFADLSLDEVRKGVIEGSNSELTNDGLDLYDLVLNGDSSMHTEGERLLNSRKKAILSEDTCRTLARNGLDTWNYEVYGRNHWTETKLLFSGSVAVPWQKPNYSVAKRAWYDDVFIFDLMPENFATTATSIEFAGLSKSDASVQRDYFSQGGDVFAKMGQRFTIELKNPAGSQVFVIDASKN